MQELFLCFRALLCCTLMLHSWDRCWGGLEGGRLGFVGGGFVRKARAYLVVQLAALGALEPNPNHQPPVGFLGF